MIIRKSRTPVGRPNTPGGGSAIRTKDGGIVKQTRLTAAQRAAMERQLAAYMQLECGHSTTREIAILYSVFAENVKDVFCDKCGDWKKRKAVKIPNHTDDCMCPVGECLFPDACRIPF